MHLPFITRFIIVRLDERELVMKYEERPDMEGVFRKEL
jgi:hypothetical protein